MDFGVGITMKVVLGNNIYPDTVGVARAVLDFFELHGGLLAGLNPELRAHDLCG